MSRSQSQRSRRRERRRRKNRNANLMIALLITAGLSLLGLLIWNSFGDPPLGESVPASPSDQHVPDGNPLPDFSTDPPTSGTHYLSPMPEGFYDEDSDEARLLPNPEGFIVHSMEHGYVVFWYNCALLTESACEDLKTELRSVMEGYDNFKIIAFPWASISVPVVATSWGYMLEMETWDPELAAEFIERNRNHSPEPNAR